MTWGLSTVSAADCFLQKVVGFPGALRFHGTERCSTKRLISEVILVCAKVRYATVI